jgi:hypothetical protein
MALRTPIYLDMETLLAHAEYCEIAVPQKEDIVEKITRQGSARATAGVSGIGLGGSVGKDVEYQTSYSLTPRHKAIVSKSIDALIAGGHTTSPAPNTVLSKDQLIEVEGISRVTTASMAGKMFHLLLRVLKESSTTVENLDFDALGPEFMEQFKSIYLGNELLPIRPTRRSPPLRVTARHARTNITNLYVSPKRAQVRGLPGRITERLLLRH